MTSGSMRDAALPRAVAICFVTRSCLSFVVALPVSAALGASKLSAVQGADRVLFEPGGLMLLELLRTSGEALSAGLGASAWLALLALVLGALPNALLFRAAYVRSEPLGNAWAAALSVFGRFVAFAGLELFGWLALLGISLVVGNQVARGIGFAEVAHDLVIALFVVSGIATAAALSIIFDLARAQSVEPEQRGFWNGFVRALGVAGRAPAGLAGGYLLTRGGGLLLVALAALVVERLDVGREGSLRLLGVVLVHQLVLLALSALRGAFALRVRNTLDSDANVSRRRSDISEHSGAPGDPIPDHDA